MLKRKGHFVIERTQRKQSYTCFSTLKDFNKTTASGPCCWALKSSPNSGVTSAPAKGKCLTWHHPQAAVCRETPPISYLLVTTVYFRICDTGNALLLLNRRVHACAHTHTHLQKAHLLQQLSQHVEMKPLGTRSWLLIYTETAHGPLRGHNACSELWSGTLSPSFPVKMFPYLVFKIQLVKLISVDGEGRVRLWSLTNGPCRESVCSTIDSAPRAVSDYRFLWKMLQFGLHRVSLLWLTFQKHTSLGE